MRSKFLLVAVMVCCFMACQKEPDATLLTPAVCKLDKIVYYDSNDPVDTVGFEYTGDQASRVNYSDYYTELEYAGTHVIKRNYFENGGTDILAFDEFIYNPDSTISRIDFYLVDPSLPQPYLFFQYDFTYNGGKLSRLQTKVDTSGNGPEAISESFFIYSGNNISQVQQYDLINQAADTLNYSFDTKQNYFGKQPNLWLSDNLFADFDGFLIPFALSSNNVISVADTQNNSTAVTYEETDKQDIETFSFDGDLWARYSYKCQ